MKKEPIIDDLSLPMTLIAILGVLYSISYHTDALKAYLPSEIAPKKPYANFGDFYGFYLSQHSDPLCRYSHILGTTLITSIMM